MTGQESASAIVKGSVWGTAVACGAGHGIRILKHSITRQAKNNVPDELGLSFPKEADSGEVKVEGDIEAYLRYDSIDLLIAIAMGATGGAPAQQGLTAAYLQIFSPAETLAGLFATYCHNNGVNVDEFRSVKVFGLTVKGKVGEPVEVTFHCIADERKTDSVTNTLVTFANVTFFEDDHRVLFSQGVFRMNAASGAALGVGDVINPSSFEFSFKRKMEGAYFVGGADTVDEPAQSGTPDISLKLGFPKYSAVTHFTQWDAKTNQKADVTFTGAVIEGAYSRSLKFEFPNLEYAGVGVPVEKGVLTQDLEFTVLGRTAAPTGMAVTDPLAITLINRQSADVLA